jgi:hypothetical protein
VWVPTSASEVEEAAARGDLEETHTFDAKAALPTAKKNHDLAVDVDAMTVDGGSILFGLGEDEDGRLTILASRTRWGSRTSRSDRPDLDLRAAVHSGARTPDRSRPDEGIPPPDKS